jgi:hypothetical protein
MLQLEECPDDCTLPSTWCKLRLARHERKKDVLWLSRPYRARASIGDRAFTKCSEGLKDLSEASDDSG